MSERTTADVLDDHLSRAGRGDVDGDLAANYSPDVVVVSNHGVEHGHEGARRLADLLARQLPGARFTYRLRLVADDVALLSWTAQADGARVDDGVDSFVVRNGRVVAQTIWYSVVTSGGTS